MSLAYCTETGASQLLETHGWNLEFAVNAFFDAVQTAPPNMSQSGESPSSS